LARHDRCRILASTTEKEADFVVLWLPGTEAAPIRRSWNVGWYPNRGSRVNVGTWEVDRARFPRGVREAADRVHRVAELEGERNPFAAVVLAHLKTVETRHEPAQRRDWKIRLVKSLFDRGLSAEEIRQLLVRHGRPATAAAGGGS